MNVRKLNTQVPPAKHRELVALTVELFHHHKKALWTARATLEVSLTKLTDAQERESECGRTLSELTPLMHTKSQKSAALLVKAAAAERAVDATRAEVAEEEAHVASVHAQIAEVTEKGTQVSVGLMTTMIAMIPVDPTGCIECCFDEANPPNTSLAGREQGSGTRAGESTREQNCG